MFSRTCSFPAAKKHTASQANRAVFCLLKKAKAVSLHIDIQIETFLKTDKPILLHAFEICEYGNVDILEQIQLNLKFILTPSLGENHAKLSTSKVNKFTSYLVYW